MLGRWIGVVKALLDSFRRELEVHYYCEIVIIAPQYLQLTEVCPR